MQAEQSFYRYVQTVAEEWDDKTADWPYIEEALDGLPTRDIDREKALALLIGLRAGERQKESRTREEFRKEILAELRLLRGTQLRSTVRRRARELARKQVDRIQSKLIFGFFLRSRARDGVPSGPQCPSGTNRIYLACRLRRSSSEARSGLRSISIAGQSTKERRWTWHRAGSKKPVRYSIRHRDRVYLGAIHRNVSFKCTQPDSAANQVYGTKSPPFRSVH
jgi:hypothetical protein